MATTVAELQVMLGLGGLGSVTSGLGDVDSALRRTAGEGERSGGVLGDMFGRVTGAAGSFVSGVVGGLGKLGLAFYGVQQLAQTFEGVFKAAFEPSIDFGKHVSGIQAVTHATKDQTQAIQELALQYGQDPHLAGISSSEALAAMEELGKEGFSPDEIIHGGAHAALLLASAGQMDPVAAAEMMGDFLHTYKLGAGQGQHLADLIAGAANASAVDPAQIALAMRQAGPTAALAGMSPEDTLAFIGLLGNRGIRGERAGTQIRTFEQLLQPQTDKAKDRAKALGLWVPGQTVYDPADLKKAEDADQDFARRQRERQIKVRSLEQDIAAEQAKRKPNLETIRHKNEEIAKIQRQMADDAPKGVKIKAGEAGGHSIFVDDTGHFKATEENARILREKLGGLSPADRVDALRDLFGADGGDAAAILMDEGPEGFAKMKAQMGGVTAEDVGAIRNDNLAGDLTQLGDSWETLRIRFGLTLTPLLRDIMQWGTGMVNAAAPVVERWGNVLAGLTGLLPTLGGALKSGDLNGAFGPIIETVSRLFGSDMAGRLTLPISGLLRGLQLGRDAFLTFQAALRGEWFGGQTTAINAFVRTLGNLGTVARNVWLAIRAGLSGDWGQLRAIWQLGIAPALQGLWQTIQPWIAQRAVDLKLQLVSWGHAFGDWVTETAVPWLHTKLPLWITALGTWAETVAAPFVGASMSRLGQALGSWVADVGIPWLLVKLPEWIAALGTWLETNAQPIIDKNLTNLGHWIGDHLLDGARAVLENNAIALFDKAATALGKDIAKLILTGSAEGFVDPANWAGVAKAMLATNPMVILMRAAMSIGKGIAEGLVVGIVDNMPDWLIKVLGGDPAATRAKAHAIHDGTYQPPAPAAGQPDDYAGPGPNQGSYQGKDGQLHPYAPGAAGGYQIPSSAAPATNNTFYISVDASGVDAESVGARVARATYIELRTLLGQPIAGPSGPTWEGAGGGAGFNR